MNQYPSFKITGNTSDLLNYLFEMKNRFYNNYTYDRPRTENYVENVFHDETSAAVFVSHNINNPTSFIWLILRNEELAIANITPKKSGQLTLQQYESIMEDFKAKVLNQYIQ